MVLENSRVGLGVVSRSLAVGMLALGWVGCWGQPTPEPSPAPWEAPQVATVSSNGGIIRFPLEGGRQVEVQVSAGATPAGSELVLEVIEPPSASLPKGLKFAGMSFDLTVKPVDGSKTVPSSTSFSAPVKISVTYLDSDWEGAGVGEGTLDLLYAYDDGTYASVAGECCKGGMTRDVANNTLSTSLCHATTFILVGLI